MPRNTPDPEEKSSKSSATERTARSNPFAVPEVGAQPDRPHVMTARVLPEAVDENEEVLLSPPERRYRPTSFQTDRFEKWFVFLLFVLGTLFVLATSLKVGMAWDEAYYMDIAVKTANWVKASLDSTSAALNPATLDAVWAKPEGHPSVTRLITALGYAARDAMDSNFTWSHLAFMRAAIAICFGLTLVMLYILVRRSHGRVSAWIAVIAYCLMPHVLGYAHFATTETPMVLMSVLVVYAFLRGLESTWWAILTGILFGLAMATKINAVLLPIILLPWAFLFYRRASVGNLYSLLFLGPLTMVLVWPWMWSDGIGHFLSYLAWNFQHNPIRVSYFGTVYATAPWHYPVVLTAITIPPATLFLLVLGIATTFRSTRQHRIGLLYLWAAAVPCIAIMASGAKYDGVRLFLPAFPFFAALAGIGGGVLVRIGAYFDRAGQRIPRGRTVLTIVLMTVLLNGGCAVFRSNPYYLAYFNSLIGGREGALARGMEVAYWGDGLNAPAIEQINALVPDGSTLMPLSLNEHVLDFYQTWGMLHRGIRIVDRGPADYHLLQFRKGMFARPERTLFEDYKPIAVFGPPGVPLLGLYKTGPAFETLWPQKPVRP